jgi:MerR family transcriptional regulator, mercuric resistance operon regulatory protein
MKVQHKKGGREPEPRTIGKLAKEAKVSVETVRFYERCGLLRQPKLPIRGWRVYDDSAVWVIHYIKLGRELGFSLGELKKLLANVGGGASFCASVQRAYEDKIALLGSRIEQMKAMRKELKKALVDCVKRSATGDCPIAQRCSQQFVLPVGQKLTTR